jgi:pyruvate formate-lyase activating enzyme-like uncharacterized protein
LRAIKKVVKSLDQIKFYDNFSKGCQSCQQGKWLCIFLTYLCNANCAFCPSPLKNEDKIVTAFGDNPVKILECIEGRPFDAISFSGGDCLLVFDRLMDWLSYFKKNRPDTYYWAYTSGLAADESKMKKLSEAGLNEIRFNIAATNYNSPSILEKIATSTRIFEKVAVEIPSIPADYHQVAEILPFLESINVNYLNLHEYILETGDPRAKTTEADTFLLNKKTELKYDVFSLRNTEKIKKFCHKNNSKIQVNNCSLQKKENQMLHRRLTMGKIFKKEYEYLTPDGLLETYLIYPKKLENSQIKNLLDSEDDFEQLEKYFIHPDIYEKKAFKKSRGTVAKILLLPPLSVDSKRDPIDVKIIK